MNTELFGKILINAKVLEFIAPYLATFFLKHTLNCVYSQFHVAKQSSCRNISGHQAILTVNTSNLSVNEYPNGKFSIWINSSRTNTERIEYLLQL